MFSLCSRTVSGLLFALLLTKGALSQSVGIGTPSPATSAQLEVSSTSRGVLFPRMSKAQRNAIASPADGLLVFQTGPDSVGFYYRFGGTWVWLQNASGAASGWSTTGNSGLQFGINYLGTRDETPLMFGFNGRHAGGIGVRNNINLGRDAGFLTYGATGTNNIAIGDSAMYSTTTGKGNIAIGTQSMKSNTSGFNNVAIGDSALAFNTTGFNNLAIGALSGYRNISGTFNTFVGHLAGTDAKRGHANVAVGQAALTYDTSGSSNVGVGVGTLGFNMARNGNTAIGYQSLLYNASLFSTLLPNQGQHNTAVGASTMLYNIRGSGSVAIGYQALYTDTAADGTIAIGRNALYNNKGKSGNLAIGDSALFNNSVGATLPIESINNVAIGSKALISNTKGSDNIAIGTNNMSNVTIAKSNIGIGTAALENNVANNRNIAIGDSSMWRVGHTTIPEPDIVTSCVDNIAIGRSTLFRGASVTKNISIGNESNRNAVWADFNVTIGDSAMADNYHGDANVAIGDRSMRRNSWGGGNVAIGSQSLYNNGGLTGSESADFNVAIGRRSGYSNRDNSGNVFLGNDAGYFAQSSNKLYIENSNKDSLNALIYGDFAADSLLLNAKTINRNLLGLRGAGANTGLEIGYGVFLKEPNAGRIGYAITTPGTLDVYGAGTSTSNRAIRFWAEGGSTFTGAVRLTGSAGTTGIYLGQDVVGKEANAGRIGYALFTPDAVDFVGGGTGTNNRQIRFWAEGGTRFTGKVIPDADNAFTLGEGGRRWSQVWSATGTIQTSDATLKTNIIPSPYGLQEVLQLTPVQYNWKETPDGKKEVGLLAQDVLKLIPEAVVVPEDGSAMGMKYSELIPVLIKAIQEQQQRIEKLEKKLALQHEQ